MGNKSITFWKLWANPTKIWSFCLLKKVLQNEFHRNFGFHSSTPNICFAEELLKKYPSDCIIHVFIDSLKTITTGFIGFCMTAPQLSWHIRQTLTRCNWSSSDSIPAVEKVLLSEYISESLSRRVPGFYPNDGHARMCATFSKTPYNSS